MVLESTAHPIPEGYTLHTENTSHILLPSSNDAFINPVQEFNRDISVACIRVWSEEMNRAKEAKWMQVQARKTGKAEESQAGRGGETVQTKRVKVGEIVETRVQALDLLFSLSPAILSLASIDDSESRSTLNKEVGFRMRTGYRVFNDATVSTQYICTPGGSFRDWSEIDPVCEGNSASKVSLLAP